MDNRRSFATRKFNRFLAVRVAGTVHDRNSVDRRLKHIVDVLPERTTHECHVGVLIQGHKNTDAVDNDDLLAVIINEVREPDGRSPESESAFNSFERIFGRFMGDQHQQDIRVILQDFLECGKQHVFVFRPSAAGHDDFFPSRDAVGNQVLRAGINTSLQYLIVAGLAHREDRHPVEVELSKILHVVPGHCKNRR